MSLKIGITTLVAFFLLIFGYSAAIPLFSAASDSPSEERLETWAENHPTAASDMGEWVKIYKDAARELFKWDLKHPERSRIFVMWVDTHQGKGIDTFAAEHEDWKQLNELIKEYRPALGAFVTWCRFHPKASAILMQHPHALHWVGKHLYKSILKEKDG